jgi:hypothetical protein
MKKACSIKIRSFCCGFFKQNLSTKKWRRKFKIIFNGKKIGKKQFKMAEIRGVQEIRFY